MDIKILKAKEDIHKEIKNLPGDKSIAHRSLIIGCIPKGTYNIYNFPKGDDCVVTLKNIEKLGAKIIYEDEYKLKVISPGIEEFKKDVGILNCDNSGTTVRLLLGILCAANIKAVLIGDESLSKRPMERILEPLRLMGGVFECSEDKLPINTTKLSNLESIEYLMTVSSAQVKSALLIAALVAKKYIVVKEVLSTRDHTEIMMKYLGADITCKGNSITLEKSNLSSKDIFIPGDISSAAFIIGLCLLAKESSVTLKDVLLNPSRRKFIDILKDMGADINTDIKETRNGELVGDIKVKSSDLKGIEIEAKYTPSIIDEIPLISVLAAFSEGTTIIKSVDELKVKESNRVDGIINNLKNCGIQSHYDNGDLFIKGGNSYISKDINIESQKDHRIAMAFAVLSIRNLKSTNINHWEYTNISFPNSIKFFSEFLNMVET
ncbi:3-phosphoshikimate 1-carboxyvinyltransferase [Clostridium algidicarnis]|uniref:3-phosphoshikimate 1-carboxyvinyltransferase n=1 Tax=Clostridium algidicarnis TaxID=37659 RepID=UPI00049832BC|nr:3-phosphoshikimate 1-carboxyvinyltransferase [Clostridium algidicarnis]